MPRNAIDKDEFIRLLMADCDRLFQDNSRLRTAGNMSPEKAQQVYKEQLAAKDVSDRATPYFWK